MHVLSAAGHESSSHDSHSAPIVSSTCRGSTSPRATPLRLVASARQSASWAASSGTIFGTHCAACHFARSFSTHAACSAVTPACSHAALYFATTGARSSGSA